MIVCVCHVCARVPAHSRRSKDDFVELASLLPPVRYSTMCALGLSSGPQAWQQVNLRRRPVSLVLYRVLLYGSGWLQSVICMGRQMGSSERLQLSGFLLDRGRTGNQPCCYSQCEAAESEVEHVISKCFKLTGAQTEKKTRAPWLPQREQAFWVNPVLTASQTCACLFMARIMEKRQGFVQHPWTRLYEPCRRWEGRAGKRFVHIRLRGKNSKFWRDYRVPTSIYRSQNNSFIVI